ncbi:glycosyltransferase [Demequina sp.]|uniref:glycosyltransferase n=1 Tax=Demequina sp. TaxID=2050685 RepID=UPI0025BE2ED5|nr:glycosyltransferase [Demequina sp.]
MSTPYVRAVLVTDGRSEHLSATLAALVALDEQPSILHIVVTGGANVDVPEALAADVRRVDAPTYADALSGLLDTAGAREGELLWLLHDDTAPHADALARLVATATKRPRAAVVGAGHVRWNDASRLVNLGTTVSKVGARRVALVVEDDINQGQHDWREDVMAVSLAGALVRREAFEALGRLDAGYEGFGDSLEWCRRAWAAGHDVVIEPRAHVRHAQDGLYGARSRRGGRGSTHARRRVSEWHHAFAWAPWWAVLPLILLIPLSVALRIVARLAQNVPRRALAELSVPLLLIARAPAIMRTSAAHRAVGATGPIEDRLFASVRQVIDAVRHRELGTFERSRASRVPSEMVKAELDAAAARQRLSLLTTTAIAALASVAVGLDYMRALVAGKMVAGPGIGSTDLAFQTVWTRAWTGWADVGFGSAGIDGAYAGLMAPFAAFPGGLRVGIGVLLIASPFVAALLAWWAAGHATRGPWIRAAVALVFGFWPPFLAAVADARVGPVLAHVALVAAAVALARAAGWRRGELVAGRIESPTPAPSPSAGLAAALAVTVATVAQPVLLLPVAVIVAVLGAMAGRLRWRVWAIATVPIVVGLPGLAAAARLAPDANLVASVLAREPGPGEAFTGSAWRVALGMADTSRWPSTLGAAWPIGIVGGVAVVACAIAAIASRRAWQTAAAGLVVMAAGGAVAAWSAHATAAWPDGAGSGAISGWPGTGSSLVLVGALVAAAGAHGTLLAGDGTRFAVGRVLSAAVATVAAGASVAVIVFVAWPGSQPGSATTVGTHVLPLAVPLEQEGLARQRVLVLASTGDGEVTYSVLTHDGSSHAIGRAEWGPEGEPLGGSGGETVAIDTLAPTVAEAVRSGAADLSALREWGIGTVVVAPGGTRIQGALDQNASLTLVGGSEIGTTYRLDGGNVSRAWFATDDERLAVKSLVTSGGPTESPTEGGTLVIATPSAIGWTAQLDGHELDRVDDPLGRVAFDVPPGGGAVTYEYRDPAQRWWWWASLAAVAWALIGSVPLRRSKEVAE